MENNSFGFQYRSDITLSLYDPEGIRSYAIAMRPEYREKDVFTQTKIRKQEVNRLWT